MQHRVKAFARVARAEVIAAELLEELFLPVHDAIAAFDLRF